MADAPRPSFPTVLEVRPTPQTENQQPAFANWISVTGGGTEPCAIDFFYLSPAFIARIAVGEAGNGIDRPSSDRVICQVPPAARVVLPLANAGDLIVNLYSLLQNPEVKAYVDLRLRAINEPGPVQQ